MTDTGNQDVFDKAFELLNVELQEKDIELEITCVGGYVLQKHGFKYTLDIDAFYNSNTVVNDIIWNIGQKLKINYNNEPWLNNSVSNLNKTPPKKYIEAKHRYSNLIVNMVSLDYVVGMKIKSGRDQDIEDIGLIIKENKKSIIELEKELHSMGFSPDLSLLMDVYEKAFGLEWLTSYYESNESTLISNMYNNPSSTLNNELFTKESCIEAINKIKAEEPDKNPNVEPRQNIKTTFNR